MIDSMQVPTGEKSPEFQQVFLHKLRHDLTNTVRPLVEIPKWIEEDLAEDGVEPSSSMRANLDMMNVYGARLSEMITDLLSYAHVGQHPEESPSTLSEIVDSIVAGTLIDEFALSTDFAHETLPIPTADIRFMMDALLSNCVKHHDREQGRIHIASRKSSGVIQIAVSDDGPGVDDKFLEKIFDPLTTLESRDTVEGSGMGLTIVRRIAQINGGQVKAISQKGKRGTCIALWFP